MSDVNKNLNTNIIEINFSCSELNFYDETIKINELLSKEEITNFLSNFVEHAESDSISYPVLGSLNNKGSHLENLPYGNLVDIESNDGDYDFKFDIDNKGLLFQKPKRDELVFIFYYYYDHEYYTLNKKNRLSKTIFEIKSFYNEALLIDRDNPEYEIIAHDASGGGYLNLQIISEDLTIDGTPDEQENLVDELNQYLITK